MASRCELCGRFRPADQPHIHFDAAVEAERPFAAAQVDKELADRKARRLLGSATIPDSTETGEFDSASDFLEQSAAMTSDPLANGLLRASAAFSRNAEALAQVKSPVRRRWPWRKRR